MDVFDNAKWIGCGKRGRGDTKKISPALEFRKNVKISGSHIFKAYICGLGFYELYINGKKVGKDVLSPPFTNYDKTVYFVEYDLTQYFIDGVNCIAVRLGDGEYNETVEEAWKFFTAAWKDMPKLIFALYSDGKPIIVSDEMWKFRYSPALYHNCVRTGEFFDATKNDGWFYVNYDDSDWQYAFLAAPPAGKLKPNFMPLIEECAEYDAVSVKEINGGLLLDFGVNISGYAKIEGRADNGETLVIKYGEKLKDGMLDQSEIAMYHRTDEFSTDKYTFCGCGVETWKPLFVYHAFRYVFIYGVNALRAINVKAVWVHTALKQIGNFSSDNDTFTWLYDCGVRTFLNNYHSIPTDCPHREKNGWTGDAQLSSDYAVKLFDIGNAFLKWIGDIIDCAKENGQISCIVPTSTWGYNWGTGPTWDYALFKLPYAVYRETGDLNIISLAYPACVKYLDYAQYYSKNGLVDYGLGDWCPPENTDVKIVSNELVNSCYYYGMQKIAEFMADLLGDGVMKKRLSVSAEKTRLSICDKYIKGNVVDGGGQSAAALVLYYDIPSENDRQSIADKLADYIVADDYHLKAGILGVKAIMNALPKYGYSDVLCKTLFKDDYPSYGFWRKLGATTFWEHWNGSQSLNHHMYGTVLDFLICGVAGVINDGTAYDKITLKPCFYAENCQAEFSKQTIRGELMFSWVKRGNEFTANIVIPQSSTATLIVCGKKINVDTGEIILKL